MFNLITSAIVLIVQFWTLILTHRADGISLHIQNIGYTVSKIFGAYFLSLWGLPEFVLVIFGFIASVVTIIFCLKFVIQNGTKKSILSRPFITVIFTFFAAVSSAIVGGPGKNQISVSSRYFFIPFTLIAFLLAYSIGKSTGSRRKQLSILVIAVLILSFSVWNRGNED